MNNTISCCNKIPVINVRKCFAEMHQKGYIHKAYEDWSDSALFCWLFQQMIYVPETYYRYFLDEASEPSSGYEIFDFRAAFRNFISFELNIDIRKYEYILLSTYEED